MVAWYEGDRERAERWLDQSLELVRGRPDSSAKARALVHRGGMHHVAGEFEEAIQVGREALPLIDHLGLDVERGRVLSSIGLSRASLGDEGGLADLEQAVTQLRAANAFTPLHAAMNNLSEMQFFFGRLAEGARTYEELVASMERFGRDTDRRWGRASLAAVRGNEGRWDEALELADRFIAETEAGSPHYLEAPCRVVRASIRFARGDLAGASADSERALEVARPAKDTQVVAPALGARASVLLAQGRRAEADALTEELLALGSKLVPALTSSFGAGIIAVARIARTLGRDAELLAVLAAGPEVPWVVAARALASGEWERAAKVLGEIECRPGEAYTHLQAAEELMGAGRASEAEAHIEAALRFYRNVGATHFIHMAEALRRPTGRDSRSAEGHVSTG
jgi:tetratricopeptide (TPR) repeat protein